MEFHSATLTLHLHSFRFWILIILFTWESFSEQVFETGFRCGRTNAHVSSMALLNGKVVVISDGELCRLTPGLDVYKANTTVTGPFVLLTAIPSSDSKFLACQATEDTCYVINYDDLQLRQTISGAGLGGSPSVQSLLAFAEISLNEPAHNVSSLYVGRTSSDGDDVTPVMSTRNFTWQDDALHISTAKEMWYDSEWDETFPFIREIKYDQVLRHSETINDHFLKVFEYRNFVYFLIRTIENGSSAITRLARVCKSDDGYHSYAETRLQCTHNGQVLENAFDASVLLSDDLSTVFVAFTSAAAESGECDHVH